MRRTDPALIAGAVLGFIGVATGAMGAHALRDRLDAQALAWWATAAQYAQIHAALMVAVALATPQSRTATVRTALACLGLGIVVFGGTLGAMALGGPRWLGAITPIGGVCLLLGWLALALAGLRVRRDESRREASG